LKTDFFYLGQAGNVEFSIGRYKAIKLAIIEAKSDMKEKVEGFPG
jgi:hypothetical protein